MVEFLKEKYLDHKYEKLSWKKIVELPVTAISGISDQDGENLEQAFNISTIRDLAENKLVRIAQTIVSLALLEELEGYSHLFA